MNSFSKKNNIENNYSPTSEIAKIAYQDFLKTYNQQLSNNEITDYIKTCMEITNSSLRAWEASDSYVKESTKLIQSFDFETLIYIGNTAKKLCAFSPMIASNYINNSALILESIDKNDLDRYTNILTNTAGSNWKDIALTNAFISVTFDLLKSIPLIHIKHVSIIAKNLSEKSHDLAITFLENFDDSLNNIHQPSRIKFIKLVNELSIVSWPDVARILETLPAALKGTSNTTTKSFLIIGYQILKNDGRKAFEDYNNAISDLINFNNLDQNWIAKFAIKINKLDSNSSVTFLQQIFILLKIYSKKDLAKWLNEGLQYMQNNPKNFDANAYFSLESTFSIQSLYRHANLELLDNKKELLEKYCKGLSGININILDVKELIDRQIGWQVSYIAATDGEHVYLPNKINIFNTKHNNFLAYKVYATHQVSRLEFGSYAYKFEYNKLLEKNSDINLKNTTEFSGITEIQKLFALFSDKKLISYLFSVVEDYRIDYLVNTKYPGISNAYNMIKKFELSKRVSPFNLPYREMLIESIIQYTLGGMRNISEELPYVDEYTQAINLLNSIKTIDGVDVNSSVEISVQIYTLLKNIPNFHSIHEIDKSKKDVVSSESISLLADSDDVSSVNLENNQETELPNLPEHLGEFKPDLVELITYVKNQQDGIESNASGFDQMQLQEFLKQTTELNVSELSEGEFSEYSNLFTNNLMDLSNAKFDKQKKLDADLENHDLHDGPISQSKYTNEKVREFFYDEWNFRSRDYKPAWCRVLEKELDFGEIDYYDQIISEHSKLIKETKRKFEYLKPESMHKEKRLEDGDEIDLDRLVDFYAEKLAGYSPLADFYSKRNKIERDVAVALLLDMSASTDEIIEKDINSSNQYNQYSGAPGTYFRWLASRNSEKSFNTNKRIIDIEKESAIVLSEALDSIGDNYGLYGFSGYGRDNVEYFVIKDIGEKLDKNVHRKIANIQPVRSTRMGPAIRHTIQKLELSSSKVKIMIMLSDGRPQDHEYGKDRTEKVYAIHDTRQALLEAKHKGITPFLLTVDKDGHDYLQEMCNDIGYEVVSDIDSLPERLTNLYKKISVK
ncbi:MAG: hypothetical protein CL779_00215 [Chloroflexi bacterium]|nr:hypothetical protein [Chloroflexota bacterium]